MRSGRRDTTPQHDADAGRREHRNDRRDEAERENGWPPAAMPTVPALPTMSCSTREMLFEHLTEETEARSVPPSVPEL